MRNTSQAPIEAPPVVGHVWSDRLLRFVLVETMPVLSIAPGQTAEVTERAIAYQEPRVYDRFGNLHAPHSDFFTQTRGLKVCK